MRLPSIRQSRPGGAGVVLAVCPCWLPQARGPNALPPNFSTALDRATSLAELSLAAGPATCVGEAAVPGPKRIPVPPLATADAPSKLTIAIPRVPTAESKNERSPPIVEIYNLIAKPTSKASKPAEPTSWVSGVQTVIHGQPLLCKDNPHDRTLTGYRVDGLEGNGIRVPRLFSLYAYGSWAAAHFAATKYLKIPEQRKERDIDQGVSPDQDLVDEPPVDLSGGVDGALPNFPAATHNAAPNVPSAQLPPVAERTKARQNTDVTTIIIGNVASLLPHLRTIVDWNANVVMLAETSSLRGLRRRCQPPYQSAITLPLVLQWGCDGSSDRNANRFGMARRAVWLSSLRNLAQSRPQVTHISTREWHRQPRCLDTLAAGSSLLLPRGRGGCLCWSGRCMA